MADTVKTTALKTLEIALGEVIGIAQVIRNPSKPIDRDTARFPLAFIFDEVERKEQRNRYAVVTVPVQIEVWSEGEESGFSDADDTMAGDIEMKLLSDLNIRLLCRDIRPDPGNSMSKFFTDERLGGFILRYIIQFHHIWGNPYDHGRT